MLILGESPRLYTQALEQYAPAKASGVEKLPFFSPDAQSLLFSSQQTAD
jgi:hypothetical protein